MTAPLTDEQLAAIEARLAAVTPGPWTMRVRPYGHEFIAIATPSPMNKPIVYVRFDDAPVDEQDEINAAFIAHAPADIAALLADNKRLRAEVARLKLAILKGVNQRHWGGCMHVMREALGDDEVTRMLNTVQP